MKIYCEKCEKKYEANPQNTKVLLVSENALALRSKCPECENKVVGNIGLPNEEWKQERLRRHACEEE